MIRYWFLLHRYLGIAISLVMLLWTLSGIVMMYKPYPELSETQKLGLLEELNFKDCCESGFTEQLRRQYRSARLEMLSGQPILKLTKDTGSISSYRLTEGRTLQTVSSDTAQQIADHFVQSQYPAESARFVTTLPYDQWTIYSGIYRSHRPLHKFALNNTAGTEFYISSSSGEVIQLTSTEQRFWGYIGAVIHWLYPTLLRKNTALWAQVVIWLTIVSIFLVVTGLYIGLRQYKKRSNGRLSPYRGWSLFHHYTGLVFGLFTLTWVSSGLLSMNPWGLLESSGPATEAKRLARGELGGAEISALINNPALNQLDEQTVRLELKMIDGAPSLIAYDKAGSKQRLNPETLQAMDLSIAQLTLLAEKIQPRSRVKSTQLITSEDSYYYSHHVSREFPAFLVQLDDAQQTRYYLSPVSGEIIAKVDSNARLYRWLFYGLHRGDFTALLRSRPVWDSFMLIFLLGVSLVSGTCCYMAIRRVRKSITLSGKEVTQPDKNELPTTNIP